MGRVRKVKDNGKRVQEYVDAASCLEALISKIGAEPDKKVDMLVDDLAGLLGFYKDNIFRLLSSGDEINNNERGLRKEARKEVRDGVLY